MNLKNRLQKIWRQKTYRNELFTWLNKNMGQREIHEISKLTAYKCPDFAKCAVFATPVVKYAHSVYIHGASAVYRLRDNVHSYTHTYTCIRCHAYMMAPCMYGELRIRRSKWTECIAVPSYNERNVSTLLNTWCFMQKSMAHTHYISENRKRFKHLNIIAIIVDGLKQFIFGHTNSHEVWNRLLL